MINILTGIDSTSAALNAERIRLEVIGQNIANANTNRGPDGLPYQRQQVVFESVLSKAQGNEGSASALPKSVQVAAIQKDPRPPRMVHIPGHPNADAQGNVAMPDINIHEEMADLISASRAFEANLAVVKNSHSMAMQSLAIGKG
jgi:flagellar basal-body rod protein FlgC